MGKMIFRSGKVQMKEYPPGDGDDTIAIGNSFLAEDLEIFQYADEPVNVGFAFYDQLITPEILLESSIAQAVGEVEAHLYARYSDITGFLWLNQEAKVGGHDLLKIFEAHLGEYGALVVSHDPIDLGMLAEEYEERGLEFHEAILNHTW